MEFEKIIELIHAVSDSNLTQFQMENGDLKIAMETNKETKQVTVMAQPSMASVAAPAAAAAQPVQAGTVTGIAAEEVAEAAKTVSGNIVKSPLVGTFYQSASPEAAPFVKVGDTVKKGQTLGIVEAMKLMNEIESEFDGVVKEILIKNEQLVEFDQPMFVIE